MSAGRVFLKKVAQAAVEALSAEESVVVSAAKREAEALAQKQLEEAAKRKLEEAAAAAKQKLEEVAAKRKQAVKDYVYKGLGLAGLYLGGKVVTVGENLITSGVEVDNKREEQLTAAKIALNEAIDSFERHAERRDEAKKEKDSKAEQHYKDEVKKDLQVCHQKIAEISRILELQRSEIQHVESGGAYLESPTGVTRTPYVHLTLLLQKKHYAKYINEVAVIVERGKKIFDVEAFKRYDVRFEGLSKMVKENQQEVSRVEQEHAVIKELEQLKNDSIYPYLGFLRLFTQADNQRVRAARDKLAERVNELQQEEGHTPEFLEKFRQYKAIVDLRASMSVCAHSDRADQSSGPSESFGSLFASSASKAAQAYADVYNPPADETPEQADRREAFETYLTLQQL